MVEQTGLPIEITRHGKVIAQVMPPDKESPTMAEWILGCLTRPINSINPSANY
jgi:antitoxin (DNA-binding transcriptional repressor) of toxin-antitoxin stability system